MAETAPSRWDTATPGDGWYMRRRGNAVSRCEFDGGSLLSNTKYAIQAALMATGPAPTFDGALVSAAEVPDLDLDAREQAWGPLLFRVLYAVAARAGATPDWLATLRAEGSSIADNTPVGPAIVVTAIAICDVLSIHSDDQATVSGLMPVVVSLTLPPGTILPRWHMLIPNSPTPLSGVCRVASLVPGATPPAGTPLPFQANPWIVLGIIGVAAVGVAIMTRDVATGSTRNAGRR